MNAKKSTFALFFGNRGLFPASLQESARAEVAGALDKLGHDHIMLDMTATRNGAVETVADGQVYANFLEQNRGKFDGVILSLPNFGDENGAVTALKDAGVPILIQAYPDDLDKMGPATRRDSFCGKFSIMDVFIQHEIPFTALKPHTVHPASPQFAENIVYFDRLCKVVKHLRNMTVGSIGARTTAFKTVRMDELALQRHGITVETLDLLDVMQRIRSVDMSNGKYRPKAEFMRSYTRWDGVPEQAFENIVKLAVVLDDIVEEMHLDAFAIRCWIELQRELGISPCVILGEFNDRLIPGACEVDLGSAITMHALSLASGQPPICLDWNNNYGDDEDKCILFHCGPVPQSLMTEKGQISDHTLLQALVGQGCSYGCNTGRIKPMPFTYGNLITRDGNLEFYLGEAKFTDDPVPADFFGCAGVAEFDDMQHTLQTIGYLGHRHHVAVTPGHVMEPIHEAFTKYLAYEVTVV